MRLRSLRGRLAASTLVLVAVVVLGGGLVVVELMQARDERDFDAQLRRVAGNLGPTVAGTMRVGPRTPPPGAPPGTVQIILDDPQTGVRDLTPGPPGPQRPFEPPPNVSRPLADAFSGITRDDTPAGEVRFVRALHPESGRRLSVGPVPEEFPGLVPRDHARTVVAGGREWRVVAQIVNGIAIEVAAPTALVGERSAELRRIVLAGGGAGLLIAVLATWFVVRFALAPLTALQRKAAGVKDTKDLAIRVHEPGQPQEVAALARELDGMLGRLQRGARQRESALQAARRFASDAGHELRTPLQSVRANLELAREPDATDEEQDTALEVADRESERLHRLVETLEALAAGDGGEPATRGEVDVGDIADGAVFSARIRHPGTDIGVAAPPQGPTLDGGDVDGVWRAVENLVENAARHGRPGGTIRVSVSATDDGCEVVVDDDGPGVPPADRESVIGRFARGVAPRGPGSGLGLAIVDVEARRHGGRLVLDDSPLGGLRARLVLCHAGSG